MGGDPQLDRLADALSALAGDGEIDVRLKRISPRTINGERADTIVPHYQLDPDLDPFAMIDRIHTDHGGGHYQVLFRRNGTMIRGRTIGLTLPGNN